MYKTEVVIIGGGLAGLSCAVHLESKGVSCIVLEADRVPGGRVRTDTVDGFLLDRGFQVLLTAYPEARRVLNYESLSLGTFASGAVVRWNGKFHKIADPRRDWSQALPALFSPVGSFADKLRVARLRSRVSRGSLEALFSRPERPAIDALRAEGFSPSIIERFFRPFLGGIFLESELATSSRKFEFVFRMFAQGEAALPARGMQAIPTQLASRLKPTTIHLGNGATRIEGTTVHTATGETVRASQVVVAVEDSAAARLLNEPAPPGPHAVTCIYYSAAESPVRGPWLVLNGEGSGPINNLCVPSEVSKSYAPPGRSLVSVTVLGNARGRESELESEVLGQLAGWYGDAVRSWKHLKTVTVPYALPNQRSGALTPAAKPTRLSPTLIRCGDYTDVASIQGALLSGRRAAEAVLNP